MISNGEIKLQNRIKTARYLLDHGAASRQEIATALSFSMPTVFQNVTDLIELGMIRESGEYGSTGGRKAKALTICGEYRYVIGLEISKNHVRQILMDLSWKVHDVMQVRCSYQNSQEYYRYLGQLVREMLEKNSGLPELESRLIGVGISIPGIIDEEAGILRRSHTLEAAGIGLQQFSQYIPYDVCFENDANNAAYAEIRDKRKDCVFFSLNETLGGAIILGGEIYKGDNFKSGEFGHAIIVPNGRRCYCGKKGCFDAYCSAHALRGNGAERLDQFFEALEQGEPGRVQRWNEYIDFLALMVSNVRMQFDCDIILGGYVGSCMKEYLPMLYERLREYNNFDFDTMYLSAGRYGSECSAIGAAMRMVDTSIAKMVI